MDISDLACDILFFQTVAPKKEQNLTYGPDKSCLHWSGGLIYVVAIETKPCLQPKTVPGTKTGQLHLPISQKRLRQLHYFGLRDGDLEQGNTVYGSRNNIFQLTNIEIKTYQLKKIILLKIHQC